MTATNKHIPGKRLKTWHRHHRAQGGTMSLLAFARNLMTLLGTPAQRETATKWAGGKAVQP